MRDHENPRHNCGRALRPELTPRGLACWPALYYADTDFLPAVVYSPLPLGTEAAARIFGSLVGVHTIREMAAGQQARSVVVDRATHGRSDFRSRRRASTTSLTSKRINREGSGARISCRQGDPARRLSRSSTRVSRPRSISDTGAGAARVGSPKEWYRRPSLREPARGSPPRAFPIPHSLP